MSGPLGSQQWMYATETQPFYPYTIDNSLRFDGSSYLYRVPLTTGDRTTWTASTWIKRSKLGVGQVIFGAINLSGTVNEQTRILFDTDDTLVCMAYNQGVIFSSASTAVFRDVSAWYHIVWVFDSTNATDSLRNRVYINGVEITMSGSYPPLNHDSFFNHANTQLNIGALADETTPYVGAQSACYLAETHFVDGTALSPSDFGEFKSGIWVPKAYSGSYGTNGFHLDFADGTNPTTLGSDAVGSNNFTPSGIATSDQMLDSPTNNFATLNPLGSVASHSEGNLRISSTASTNWCTAPATIVLPKTGLWYMEARGVSGDTHLFIMMGVAEETQAKPYAGGTYPGSTATSWGVLFRPDDGDIDKYTNGSPTNIGSGVTNSTVAGIVWDADNGALYAYLDGAYVNTAYSGLDTSKDYVLQCGAYSTGVIAYNFGNDGTFGGLETGGNAGGNPDGSSGGYGDFATVVPTVGGKQAMALCTQNLPVPAFDPAQGESPQDAFNVYTDTGANILSTAQSDYSDGLFWIKDRASSSTDHQLLNTVTNTVLESNTNDAERAYSAPSGSSVAWAWKGGGSSNTFNVDGVGYADATAAGLHVGSQEPTGATVNTKAGVGIYKYAGDGNTRTIAHGLGVAPSVVLLKNVTNSSNWIFYTNAVDGTMDYTVLNSTNVFAASGRSLTSTTFDHGDDINQGSASNNYIAWVFAEKEGFSKFGSYEGNANADGSFVYLGFRPAWVLVKNADASSTNWGIFDNKRDGYNVDNNYLIANSIATEDTGDHIDLLSNGFKMRSTTFNASNTYFYMAFAETPFKYSNAR